MRKQIWEDFFMKIGVALSGGGIRGIAHAGVLQALIEEKIPIDVIRWN
jgi:predicted acylesterase/phospholipase RssA